MIATAIEDHVSSRIGVLQDLLARSAKYQDDDVRAAQEKRLQRDIEILERMKQRANAIRTNETLSEKGMAEQLLQVARGTLKELSPLFDEADKADKRYIREYSEMTSVPELPAGKNEVVVLMREQELRQWLRTLPLESLMHLFIAAVQKGDVEFVRAVRTAPGPALLSADFIERVAKDHIAMTQKDKLVHLEGLDLVRQELREVSQMLKNWLLGYEPLQSTALPTKSLPASAAAR
jgi:hypothetical protein